MIPLSRASCSSLGSRSCVWPVRLATAAVAPPTSPCWAFIPLSLALRKLPSSKRGYSKNSTERTDQGGGGENSKNPGFKGVRAHISKSALSTEKPPSPRPPVATTATPTTGKVKQAAKTTNKESRSKNRYRLKIFIANTPRPIRKARRPLTATKSDPFAAEFADKVEEKSIIGVRTEEGSDPNSAALTDEGKEKYIPGTARQHRHLDHSSSFFSSSSPPIPAEQKIRHPLRKAWRQIEKKQPKNTMERTYENALQLLGKIESNRAAIAKATATNIATTATTSFSSSLTGLTSATTTTPSLFLSDFRAELSAVGLLTKKDEEKFPFKAIHIAGTKGKGSVAAYCTSLLLELRRNGEPEYEAIGKIGTYTSPHLLDVRERICIDGEPVDKDVFTARFFEVWDMLSEATIEKVRRMNKKDTDPKDEKSGEYMHLLTPEDLERKRGENNVVVKKVQARGRHGAMATMTSSLEYAWGPLSKPFFFRFMTLLAFYIFAKEGVQSAVVEVGIGGLHDPTNILPPQNVSAAVVTQLGLDHTEMLGNTIEKITEQKAGIFKFGRKAIVMDLGEEGKNVMEVLRSCAHYKHADLLEIVGGVEWTRPPPGEEVGSTMGGTFQSHNRALALYAVRSHLRALCLPFPDPLLLLGPKNQCSVVEPPSLSLLPPEWETGLSNARLRGRCEILPDPSPSLTPAPALDSDSGSEARTQPTKPKPTYPGLTWYIDGAHTTESLAETGKWFANQLLARGKNSNVCLIFNQQDRDAVWLLTSLTSSLTRHVPLPELEAAMPIIDLAVFTRNEVDPPPPPPPPESSSQTPSLPGQQSRKMAVPLACKRAAEMQGLATNAVVTDNVTDAVRRCRQFVNESNEPLTNVLVTGSLHLVAGVLKVLEKPEPEPDAQVGVGHEESLEQLSSRI